VLAAAGADRAGSGLGVGAWDRGAGFMMALAGGLLVKYEKQVRAGLLFDQRAEK
jgi:hypothetical protein